MKIFLQLKQKALILSLIGVALYCDVAHGQYIPTVEEGKEWTINLYYGLGNSQYSKYTLWCDTMIQGNTYLAIYNDADNIVGFLREDTSLQVVYFLAVNAEAEKTILSYTGEAGDTIHLTNADLVIQEVYYESLFGAMRKVIVIDDFLSLIEGAGTSRYGIISDYTLPWPWPSLSDLQISNASCESITSTIEVQESISTYPNPFTHFIHISTPESLPGYYEVYNAFGIRLLSGDFINACTVDTEALIPGIYLLVINRQMIKMIKL